MDERTLTALRASIAHWERNVAAESLEAASTGPGACALCDLFYWTRPDCAGCPVAARTGCANCVGSPYEAASGALFAWFRGISDGATFRAAAQAELDFLRSLLPAEEKSA